MQGIILDYYPPVIKQIREMQQIARAEDIEFKKLMENEQSVINNMFISTANETGIEKYEKMLGIPPETGKSLTDRKITLISKANRKKTGLSKIEEMLNNYSEGVEILNDFCADEMEVVMKVDDASKKTLEKILEDMLPLNIYFEVTRSLKKNNLYLGATIESETYINIGWEGE